LSLLRIFIVALKEIARISRWVQDSPLSPAKSFFYLGLVVDGRTETVVPDLTQWLALGISDES